MYIMNTEYNENSHPQMVSVNSTIKYIHEAINVLDVKDLSLPYIIADFGSSLGRNSQYIMKIIIQYLKQVNKIKDENYILVIHNDLPTNDWQTLFHLLNNDQSYYESCLPSNSLVNCREHKQFEKLIYTRKSMTFFHNPVSF